MDTLSFHEAIRRGTPQQSIPKLPTKWKSLNDALGGGIPQGRLVEVYGPSQIGKSAMAIHMFPGQKAVLFDLGRKLCRDYLTSTGTDILPDQGLNNDELFEATSELIQNNVIVIIDDLTHLGNYFTNDRERFRWLTSRFLTLQRTLVSTKSIVIVLNQIRVMPSTGNTYNPHAGCMDAAIKIKLHTAEKRGKDRLIYVDIEKSFWGHAENRCTLLVSKTQVTER